MMKKPFIFHNIIFFFVNAFNSMANINHIYWTMNDENFRLKFNYKYGIDKVKFK